MEKSGGIPIEATLRTEHHIWCNFFLAYPANGCSMCDRLYQDYPSDGLTPDELTAKHFPDNKRVR